MFAKRHSLLMKFVLTIGSVGLTILIIEVSFRAIGFDFERKAAALQKIPIFYRIPTQPVDSVFFRRPGPDVWKGRVLSTGYERVFGGKDHPYPNEKEATIQYDRQGLRNPEGLTDWDIVIVGDSCVELGYLTYEDLFSTRVADLLGVRIKNLGISYPGTVSQAFVLRAYGKSPSTKHAIVVFFEGNDVTDIESETRAIENYKATGTRTYRELKNQSSFVKAVYDQLHYLFVPPKQKDLTPHYAYYTFHDKQTLVSLDYTPPAKSELTSDQTAMVDTALGNFAKTARDLGLTPWLVFMPCKRRVLDGHLKFTESTDQKYVQWQPTDLPELIRQLSEKNDMKFVDATPALAKAANDGMLPYNPIWDTHLNRDGSEIVAHVIADALRSTNKK